MESLFLDILFQHKHFQVLFLQLPFRLLVHFNLIEELYHLIRSHRLVIQVLKELRSDGLASLENPPVILKYAILVRVLLQDPDRLLTSLLPPV